MPITKSAKKTHRASENRRVFNLRRTRVMKGTLKEVNKLLSAGKKADAQSLLPKAQKAIDKAAKRGIIKKNNAARKKARLAKAIKNAK